MQKTLPQLGLEAAELNHLLAALDEAELTPEQEQAALEDLYKKLLANKEGLEERVNAWCWAIKSLNGEAEFYRKESQRLAAVAKVRENRANSMKRFLVLIVEFVGKDGKFPTTHFPKLSVRNTAESVVLNEEYSGEVPADLLKDLALEDKVSKSKVKDYLKTGKELPWAWLQKGRSLFGLS